MDRWIRFTSDRLRADLRAAPVARGAMTRSLSPRAPAGTLAPGRRSPEPAGGGRHPEREGRMAEVTANELYALVIAMFGVRAGSEGQAPTSAVGVIKEQAGVYVVVQGRPFDSYEELSEAWEEHFDEDLPVDEIIDARNLLVTARKKGEWTGYHAEMMIVGAMISANVWNHLDWAGVKAQIAA